MQTLDEGDLATLRFQIPVLMNGKTNAVHSHSYHDLADATGMLITAFPQACLDWHIADSYCVTITAHLHQSNLHASTE